MTRFYHEPILVRAVIAGLNVTPRKRYIDATLGGAGHAIEIIKRGGLVLGIDADIEAIKFSRSRIQKEMSGVNAIREGIDWKIVQGNFRDIEIIAREQGFESVDGILFDLGVSSHQLDTKERGFSYRFDDAPLDMRLNQAQKYSAQEFLQRAGYEELYEIIARYSEEERAGAIAAAIVRARTIAPIITAGDVVHIIEKLGISEHDQSAVLSRLFQAIRIAVNDELQALKTGLLGAQHLIVPGGRIAVISFHSLEDRIVKLTLGKSPWIPITKKTVIADEDELQRNKRARSAKLRIAQKT